MKPSIFGDGAALVDRFDGPEEIPGDSIAEKDARAVDRVVAALGSEAAGGGHLFVVALNAAHWRYQWGPDFAPVVPDFRTFVSVQNTFTDDPRSRAMLFARYKNAVAYLDGLVGRLVAGIDDRGARDRTLLAVVGDHGEEFGEHGQVTHCSALVGPQLAPALLFRIPGDRARAAHPAVASHLDILPTIFDALDVGSGEGALYRGTSLLAAGARRPPVSVQTSAREPQRFRVLDGDVAAQFELVRPWSYKRELHTPKLRLLELTDAEGHGLPAPPAPDALARRLLGPDGADLLEPAPASERQAASRPAAAP
jgi:arylsulfatase A-like enzyme